MSEKIKLFSLLILLTIGAQPLFAHDEIELVESFPVNTTLDLTQIRNTTKVWLEMINSAKKSIDIETFYISAKKDEPLDDILDAIKAAAKRGTKVRIISEKKFHKTYPEPLNSLDIIDGIDVRIIDFGKIAGGVMHAKYFIVDDEQIFLGSQNFDWRSLKHIHELGVRVKNDQVVSVFKKVYETDWELAKNPNTKPGPIGIDESEIPVNLDIENRTIPVTPVYSPQNFIPNPNLWDEPKIIDMINNAEKSVQIQLLSYAPTTYRGEYYAHLDNALRAASVRGVKVQMILSDWSKRKPGISYLKSLAVMPNIDVKLSTIPPVEEHIPYARVDHCKYLLVDEKEFWIGTSNWSKEYFYNGRNLGLIVEDITLAKQVSYFFNFNWQSDYTYLIDPCTDYEPPKIGE